jgi:hypothetical protein
MSCSVRALMAALAAAAIGLGCSNSPVGGASDSGSETSCTPACGAGSTCSNGQCTSDDGGAAVQDAGGGQGSEDGGAAAQDAGGGQGGDDGGTAAQDGGGGQGSDDGGSPSTDGGIQPCQAISSKAKRQPLDIFIMLDRSSSMNESVTSGGTRWSAVTASLNSFLGQTGMEGISVGLQYFPLGTGDQRCEVANYSAPAVEIAAIAESGSMISSSMANQNLGSGTPTSAALEGAIEHAKAWATAHTEDAVVVVLATDGEPHECDTNIDNIAAIAAAGADATPKVLTFVIGVGPSLDNLNAIAKGGGTTAAFLVTGDVSTQFLAALNGIRGATTGCTYLLEDPAGQILDPTKVNVEYKQAGTTSVGLVQVQGQSSCADNLDAGYYDDPMTPSKILVCPATCAKIQQDVNAEVNVLLGCKTNSGPN